VTYGRHANRAGHALGAPPGLRLAFLIGALSSLSFGLSSLIAAGLVADLAGLPHLDPLFQQARGSTLGLGVGALLALWAKRFEQVRIPLAMGLTTALLSAVGGLYYFATALHFQVTPYLLGVVLVSLYLLLANAYYLVRGARRPAN
jgi:hypothetical protein